jgi:hypothetical protein
MNEPNLRILQDNLAGLAFTDHFYMGQWTRPLSDLLGPHKCGTSLCIGGLATALELSKTKQSYQLTLDNLSNETLYDQLHEQWLEEDNFNFFIFYASKYLGIPYDNVAPIWHKHVWPTALIDLYDATYHSEIRQKYFLTFPNSPLSYYSIPSCFWKTLAGFLALEAFYEYTSDPKDSEAWVNASAEDIEATLILSDKLHRYKNLSLWLTKYSDRIIHFENIAIQSEPAKQFILN